MLILNSFGISMYVKVLFESFKQFRANWQLVRTNSYCCLLTWVFLNHTLSILERELHIVRIWKRKTFLKNWREKCSGKWWDRPSSSDINRLESCNRRKTLGNRLNPKNHLNLGQRNVSKVNSALWFHTSGSQGKPKTTWTRVVPENLWHINTFKHSKGRGMLFRFLCLLESS